MSGAVLTPRFLEGMRISIDYSRIIKSGEIASISVFDILANEELFPGRVQRTGPLPTDPPGTPGPITLVDASLINISRTRIRAWDFQADYEYESHGLGRFRVYGIGTLQTEFRRQVLLTDIAQNSVGFSDGPLRWRGQFGVDWSLGGISVNWNTQYYSSYKVSYANEPPSVNARRLALQGREGVPSQIYHDISVRYVFKTRANPLLEGMEITIGVQNIFDKRPPTIADLLRGYSMYGDPRLRRFVLGARKQF